MTPFEIFHNIAGKLYDIWMSPPVQGKLAYSRTRGIVVYDRAYDKLYNEWGKASDSTQQ